MFILLGDSHTRSYKIPAFIATRVFLAQGRKNNFFNPVNFLATTFRYIRATYKVKQSQLDYAFIIGEPDIRRLVYGEWDTGRSEEVVLSSKMQLSADEKKVKRLCSKVKLFLWVTHIFGCRPALIIGCGTPNPEMIAASLSFNQQLAVVCSQLGCLFFDPQQHAVSSDGTLLKPFIGYSIFNPLQKDHTHLSGNISQCLEKFLYEKRAGTDSAVNAGWRKKIDFDHHFVEVKNFDTYKMKDLWLIALLKKTKRSFMQLVSK